VLLVGARADYAEVEDALGEGDISCVIVENTETVLLRAAMYAVENPDSATTRGDRDPWMGEEPVIVSALEPPEWILCGDAGGTASTAMDGEQLAPTSANEDWREHGRPTPYAIFFTSGTTARPKGVILSHQAMLVQAVAKLKHVGYSAQSRYLHLAPLFHLGGASSALAVTLAGGVHVLEAVAPRSERVRKQTPSMSDTCSAIVRHRVNTLVVVPAILQMLLDEVQSSGHECDVATLLYGGGSLTTAQLVSAQRLLPGCRLIGAYGMTETASTMTFVDHSTLPADSPAHSSVGRPPEHAELRILETTESFRREDGFLFGEIATRGPHVMDGYFRRTAETSAAFDLGWFRTGDLGYMDDSGHLFLVGRAKDMIRSGGESVLAGEVEQVLSRHPAVTSTAVVGVPHRVLGEAVAAAVIATEWPGEERLALWCRDGLSSYKRPRWILGMDRFPLSSTGKVLKEELREEILERLHTRAKL
jgi:acyl-CoA synthetase (AMP-forming)/AMP-acid ligase II